MMLRVILLVLFVAVACASLFFISVEDIANTLPLFQDGVSMHRAFAVAVFSIIYALAFGFTVPVTTVLAVAGGAFFGLWTSLASVIIASLIGAVGVYMLGRRFHHVLGERIIGSRFQTLVDEASTHPVSFMLSTRFAPLVPFPVVHVVPAMANIRLRDFLWTTLAGIIPASFGFVLIGDALMRQVLGYSTLIEVVPLIIAGISVAFLLPVAFRWHYKKKH